MSKRLIVELRARAGTETRMREELGKLRAATRREPGCLRFDFYQSIEEDGAFVLIEDFADQAAFDLHMAARYTKDYFALDLMEQSHFIGREWFG